MRFFVAITGASGAVYGVRVAGKLLDFGHDVFLCATRTGLEIVRDEVLPDSAPADLGYEEVLSFTLKDAQRLPVVVRPDDFGVPFASGSNPPDGMVIAPCSMGALARVATGASTNLIERAADVCLKERKRLILVTRETPLNLIHVRNMESVTRAGAVVMPASPSFYRRPASVDELVDYFVERVLTVLGIEDACTYRWGY